MWRFAAARATGSSHAKVALPCQDWFACATHSEVLVAAIADGAGSAAMAERGAEVAVTAVVGEVLTALAAGCGDHAEMLLGAATAARRRVLALAQEHAVESREFASTLLVAIVGPASGAALQIGDGVIVVSDDGVGWSWIFWPQRGEYANTTRFLTDEDALASLRLETFRHDATDVALMTDGLEPLALHYASMSAHEPFFRGVFAPLVTTDGVDEVAPVSSALETFLASPRVTARTDDDVSLIIATRRRPPQLP